MVKKLFFVIAVLFMLFLTGCIQIPQQNSTNWNNTALQMENCRLVEQEIPYTELVCENQTETQQECTMRELSYKTSSIQEYDICMTGNGCSGKNLSLCQNVCTQANKRCVIEITNTDKVNGRWTVGATFVQGGAVFVKNPQTQEIKPGETKKFDFIHIYNMEKGRLTTTTCTLQVIYPATTEECKSISKQVEVCKEVKKTKIEEKEICD
ncbi:MAG: hypothetical protein QW153_03030 [Candidatus Bilamarchaeaceae archaeon]